MSPAQTKSNEAQQSANEIFALAVEERQEQQKVRAKNAHVVSTWPRERMCLAGVVVTAPLLIALVLFNVLGVSPAAWFETPPSPDVARQQAQQTLDGLVMDIEAFKKDTKELPESLVEIGVPPRGSWTYTRVGTTSYRVQGAMYGQNVKFDAAAAGKDRP